MSAMPQDSSAVRNFKMHPDLLFSVIEAQAGTHEKALLEAVMNAVDASATKCVLTLTQTGFSVQDDGKGFSSQQEIDEFFETFGTPHKEGDATYGRFRMGRGQLFAFATTKWRTTSFEMAVDIKNKGLDYLFTANLPEVKGCTIEGVWYDPLSIGELFNVEHSLIKLIQYMQIPVFINGKQVSVDAKAQKWDFICDDFYIKVNKTGSTLAVYNMGALVTNYPASKFGVAGTVVTTSALKVNFARNDVLVSKCSLWKKISAKLNELMGVAVSKKTTLSQAERDALLSQFAAKQILASDILTKSLFADMSGKRLTLKQLVSLSKVAFSSGDYTNRRAEERLNSNKTICVLSTEVLSSMRVDTPAKFLEVINELISHNNTHWKGKADAAYAISRKYADYKVNQNNCVSLFNPAVVEVAPLIAGMAKTCVEVPANELTKQEKAFVSALNQMSKWVACGIANYRARDSHTSKSSSAKQLTRTVKLGRSDCARAWTDSLTTIWFNRNTLQANPLELAHIMVHEYCHDLDSSADHDHGPEFYEMFHSVTTSCSYFINYAITEFSRKLNKDLAAAGVKPRVKIDEQLELATSTEAFQNAIADSLSVDS